MNKQNTLTLILTTVLIIILISTVTLTVFISNDKDKTEYDVYRSIYNTKASGYAAWYKIAKKSGLNIKPWRFDFYSLIKNSKDKATMIVNSPGLVARKLNYFGISDIETLLDWVKKGNTLIFIDDFSFASSKRLLDALNIEFVYAGNKVFFRDKYHKKEYYGNKQVFNIPKSSEISKKVTKISSSSLARLKGEYIDTIISDTKGIILGKRKYGKGLIYILTIPDVADNSYLYEKEDNYQFLTNLASVNSNTIYVNEFIHGNIKNDSIMSYYNNTVLNPIFKQFAILILLLIFSVSRRFGKPLNLKQPDRKNNMEYVKSISLLYTRAGLTGTALAPIYKDFRSNLCKNLKLDLDTTDSNLVSYLKNNNYPDELISLVIKVKAAATNNDISKEDMLDLCMKLNEYRLKGLIYAARN